ncbi:protein argonaute 1 [Tanacetum coccineum]
MMEQDSKYQKPPFITFGCKVADGYGTHPARCIPELMRILMDVKAISWKVTTPFLFKLIPAVVHLGVLLRWWRIGNAEQITESAILAGHP